MQLLKAVNVFLLLQKPTEAAGVGSMWLTHLELDALEKIIFFLCLVFFLLSVFPSWENLKKYDYLGYIFLS